MYIHFFFFLSTSLYKLVFRALWVYSPENRNTFLTAHSTPAVRLHLLWKNMQDPVHYHEEHRLTCRKSQTHVVFRGWDNTILTFLLRLALTVETPPLGACMSLLFWSLFFIPFILPCPRMLATLPLPLPTSQVPSCLLTPSRVRGEWIIPGFPWRSGG